MRRLRVKPSRTQSLFGFIGGIIFVIIGIAFVIPNAGGFGVVWTLFAIIITSINAMNAFGEKGVASYEIETDAFDHQSNTGSQDFAKKLRDLENLKNEGLITQEEYEEKRNQILNDKW